MYVIQYTALDVLMWNLVWIGVAVIPLDYPSVDVGVYVLSMENKYVTESRRLLFLKCLERLRQKNEAYKCVHLVGSLDCGIMPSVHAHEDYVLWS